MYFEQINPVKYVCSTGLNSQFMMSNRYSLWSVCSDDLSLNHPPLTLSRLHPTARRPSRNIQHHDQAFGVGVRCIASLRSLGIYHVRHPEDEHPSDLQGGRLAHAPLPAGHVRVQSGHLQRLRRRSQGTTGADQRSQRGLEKKGIKVLNKNWHIFETLEEKAWKLTFRFCRPL